MKENTIMKKTDNNVFFDYEEKFSQDKFNDVPVDCTPVFAWLWNSKLSFEATDKGLNEFKSMGVKTLYVLPQPCNFSPCGIPTTMYTEYLGEDYMKHYAYAAAKAKELGIQLWLYDEGGWPSGGACGRVLAEHPEYARKCLTYETKLYATGETYVKNNDEIAFTSLGGIVEDGYTFMQDTEVTTYYSKPTLYDWAGHSDFPDISLKETTDTFIEMTHEEYKKHIGEDFGSHIKAVFTDEPTLPRPIPYRPDLEEKFEKEQGYSIRPYLPYLAGHRLPQDEKSREAVIAWYDMCSHLFCNNFMMPCKEWSNKHEMAFLGHLDIDHKPHGSVQGGNFNIMRAMRCFDVPGIDVIWRQIFRGEKSYYYDNVFCENRFFPRYASSAASQIGGDRSVTETCGVFGFGLTFDETRYVVNFQAIRGINIFNMMLTPYGEEKGHQRVGETPYLREKYACLCDYKYFNKYLERVSYVCSVGKDVSDVALYLPVKDFYVYEPEGEEVREYDRVGFGMEDKQIPFDIFDDDVILLADRDMLKKGVIDMGSARYTTLVITSCRYMAKEAKELLGEFIKGGGRVIATTEAAFREISGCVLCADVWDIVKSPLDFAGDTKGIRLMQRNAENAKLYYISNEAVSAKDICVSAQDGVYLINLTDGKITKPEVKDGKTAFTLESGEMFVLMYTDDEIATDEVTVYEKESILDGNYTAKKTKQFVLDELYAVSKDINEEERSITLGDWRTFAGESFSGSIVYKTSFPAPEGAKKLMLDLGKVNYTCEVFVNGKSVGVKVMPPYKFTLDIKDIKEYNELEVRVSNTAANEYYYTKAFDKWASWMLTPYHEKCQIFHEDSLPSGLFGPIKLLY